MLIFFYIGSSSTYTAVFDAARRIVRAGLNHELQHRSAPAAKVIREGTKPSRKDEPRDKGRGLSP